MLGIFAAFLFQILTARTLGPMDFSLFAAFIAIVNIGAIGSSALQNSVTVQTARLIATGRTRAKTKPDPTLIEATAMGSVLFIAIFLFSSPLARALSAPTWVVLLAGTSVILSFLMARNMGIMQGVGRALSTVSLTSSHSIVRLILGSSVFVVSFGFGGLVAVVMVSLLIVTVWSAIYLRRIPIRPTQSPFNRVTVSVFLSTVAFAWLTNVDVIFLRALADPLDSGNYAVVALLVKTAFIVPGTLSLYFLPKLIHTHKKASGLSVLMGITGFGVVLLTSFLWFFGPAVIDVFFGSGYQVTADFILLMCVSIFPWVIMQTILIRTNGLATVSAPVILVCGAAIQWLLLTFTLPDVEAMIVSNGILGVVICIALWITLLIKKKERYSAIDVNSMI
jgi:O-antigen/teichoic acid export membrane protein